jgi:hypothetical protein
LNFPRHSKTQKKAPPNCLQYITESTGTVKSFNWKDVAASATSQRQLADQDYQICFRTELVGSNQQVKDNQFPLTTLQEKKK